MDVYDKFVELLEDAKGFNYKKEWNILKGIESPVDFAMELTNVDELLVYNSGKHLGSDFTGFLKSDKKQIEVNGVKEYVDFIYLEKGVLRYFQGHEGNDSLYAKKFNFLNDNFSLLKGYYSNNEGKLTLVHRNDNFKLDNLNIGFSRIWEGDFSIYLMGAKDLPLYSSNLSGEIADKLSEDIFQNYGGFVKFFKGSKGNIFGNDFDVDELYEFDYALDVLRKE